MLIDSANAATSDRLSLTTLEPYLCVVKAYCDLLSRNDTFDRKFRSHELEANARQAFPDSCHSPFCRAMLQQLDAMHVKRSQITNDERGHPPATIDEGGRLLLVNWMQSLFDGACSPITHGFLDDDCMPGWDTWVRIVSIDEARVAHGLVCWIPSELVAAVNDAILIDAAQCMSWLRQDSSGMLNAAGWGTPL